VSNAIELARSDDVQVAQQAALSALADREQSEVAVTTAKAELARIKDAFERHPQAGHPIWRERAARLAEVLIAPMTTAAVIERARRIGWNEEVTREVLAAGDGLELVKVLGLWRSARREMVSP
jgi:hypothetical protein